MAKTPVDIVSDMVALHAGLDRDLANAYRKGGKMVKAVEDGLSLGMIADGMAAKQYIWQMRCALGDIADAGLAYAALHPIGTQHAKDNGVDLGRITEAGGVKLPQPEILPMGLGR
jgi:hypothetical protein